MYFKLALRNVKKSYRDFLIYFLTLTFSVCLFYTFNSFQSQQAVMKMNESQMSIIDSLSMLMNYLSVFVAIVLAFLILYANNFLIRRRKKELGIYTILGMPKRKISTILVYETLVIGFISLFSGMVLGIIASQVLTAVTANLFVVPLNYSFVFSPVATVLTILSFTIIFVITMIFNTLILNRYRLIDLLNADRKSDEFKIKKIWLSVILFIAAISFLGWAYYQTESKGLFAFENLGAIILAGCIGTLLFFLSLAGFLLTVFKSSKNIYFKNLNCFILRQIHSNINVNFISMSIVCIMLLLSIGALSTGLSLNSTVNASIKNSTPYDYSLTYINKWNSNQTEKYNELPLPEFIKQLDIDNSYIQSQTFINSYLSNVKIGDKEIMQHIHDKSTKLMFQDIKDTPVHVIPLSSFNKVRERQDYSPIKLKDNEIYAYSTTDVATKTMKQIMDAKQEFNLFGKKMNVVNNKYEFLSLYTTPNMSEDVIAFVVNDTVIPPTEKIASSYWNVQVSKKTTIEKFDRYMQNKIEKYNKMHESDSTHVYYRSSNRTEIYDMNKGMSIVFIYIGIYLGIVFMIASAVILALQQLSQANDNKKRYVILTKIGTEQKMMNRSILMQIGIYFFMPLALAIVHSYIGIRLVNNLVTMFGKGDILVSSLFTACVILVIYGSYFLVTYFGYKNILKS